jgi:hypothetical protein
MPITVALFFLMYSSCLPPRAFVPFSPEPCHSCTVGRPPVGTGQSLPGFTTCLDPSLWLLAVTHSQIPVPRQLPQSSNWHHWGFFLGDFLMLHYRVHHSWIRLNLLSTYWIFSVHASISSWQVVVSWQVFWRLCVLWLMGITFNLVLDGLIWLWQHGLYCSFHFFLISLSVHLHSGD